MNVRPILLFILLMLFSCSDESFEGSSLVIEGKELKSITQIEYVYLYVGLPPTRTHTTTYSFSNKNVVAINQTTFHYWHDEPERNSTAYADFTLNYNGNNQLINIIAEHEHLDYSASQTYDFEYQENRLYKAFYRSGNDFLFERTYTYDGNFVTIKYNNYYYLDQQGEIAIYDWYIDQDQINFKNSYRGNIFYALADGEPNFNPPQNTLNDLGIYSDGNFRQSLIGDELFEEYQYSSIKIPEDFPKIYLDEYLPLYSWNTNLYTIAEGVRKSYLSYNTNYIEQIIPSNPLITTVKTYNYLLSKDNYPLNLKIYDGDRIMKDVTYNYE